MPYAEVNQERIYYELGGDGPPLVLIRGLSRSMRFWEPLIPFLAGHFTLLTYDHRGIGRSPIRDKRFTVRHLAADLAGLIEHSGLGRAHVFGLSLGGMVAQHLAVDHPDLVDRLVLGSTTAGGWNSRFPRLDTLAMLAMFNRLPDHIGCPLMGPRLISPAAHRARPEVAKSWVAHLQKEPLDPRVVLQQALAGALHDVWARLPEVQAETLVVTGDCDRLINGVNSERIAQRIPNARLQVLPGRGHDIVAESPADVAGLMKGFLLEERRTQAA